MKRSQFNSPESLRELAISALVDVLSDAESPAAARAGAARTLAEILGLLGRNQDLNRLDERRSAAEMNPQELEAEITRMRLLQPTPKPRMRKVKTP